jgi:putative N-acetylmannosamine-6-phosphate epimerase
MHPVIERLRGGLIVSCQAAPPSPLRDSRIIAALAECAERGGAVGVRIDSPDDIAAVRRALSIPVIGIYKIRDAAPVYITPTFRAAQAVARAGADIVAIQATSERTPAADPLPYLIARVHAEWGIPVMADVATLDEGREAAAAGADLVATTMSGYTPSSRQISGPDLDLVAELAGALKVPVVAEGRIRTPEDAAAALRAGAWAVVVGRAITMPEAITARFVEALASLTPRRGSHLRNR